MRWFVDRPKPTLHRYQNVRRHLDQFPGKKRALRHFPDHRNHSRHRDASFKRDNEMQIKVWIKTKTFWVNQRLFPNAHSGLSHQKKKKKDETNYKASKWKSEEKSEMIFVWSVSSTHFANKIWMSASALITSRKLSLECFDHTAKASWRILLVCPGSRADIDWFNKLEIKESYKSS